MTKIISVIGDSHTWGQGVGADYPFRPGVCAGDLRMIPFKNPGYVNLLRHAVNLRTGSGAEEYFGPRLHALCEEAEDDYGYFAATPLELEETFSCVRIYFRSGSADTSVEVYLDDKLAETVFLPAEEPVSNRCIQARFYRTEEKKHRPHKEFRGHC